ncbi:MAG: site-2 protease family protein [Pirellulales bacterium]
MGLSLIALSLSWDLLVVILEVALVLGMVIFVHELGHFLVAKWCGVKCEKFYLGFDIYGLKLAKYRWGETEYGIGILPLGGYVKMLGQDDNPSRAAQERDRSQLESDGATAQTPDETGASERLNPRSYLAKSVPQRMAIISAGVVMNVIFAFICAVAAYQLGVPETVCGVSAVMPGEAAWRADLEPGDRILRIEGYEGPLRFRDLMSAVALGNLADGVDFLIQREGVKQPFWVNLKPETADGRLLPTIGVASPLSPTLERNPFVDGGTPAAETGQFKVGDTIVAVGPVPVKTYADILSELNRHNDESLTITVERQAKNPAHDAERLDVTVQPQPRRTLGLAMTMGKITAIQHGSPAARAALRPGDMIETIDGEKPGDPLRLPDLLRRRAGETVKLVVSRPRESGERQTIEKQITLRDRPWPIESVMPSNPVAVPALGLAYEVLATVRDVDEDSPAAKATLTKDDRPAARPRFAAGDEIVKAEFELPELSQSEREKRETDITQFWLTRVPSEIKVVEFSAEKTNWPFVMSLLQQLPLGTKVTLSTKDGRTGTIASAPAPDWYYFDRGFRYGADTMIVRADSFSQALSMGGRETGDMLLLVYKFLRRLGSQVSPFALGGPVTIATAAGSAASEGLSSLLLFVTLLSANLAVINFLPIPLLDGGHMVFLILEGIMRRPVSEKVVIAFHYAGFVFLISLMLFVLGLDVSRIF